MAPEATNHRESSSFDAILDNTNPEKLVQIIREKRGLHNAKRIFPETNIEKKTNKRKSFPFEIQPRPTTPPAKSVESTNENSVSVANVKVIPKSRNNNEETERTESENAENRSKTRFKVPPRRKSHNLGRRVLLKAFEVTPQVDEFYPVASSTPLQKNTPCEEFGSFISNINRDSGDEVSSSNQNKNTEDNCENHQLKITQEHNQEESIVTETNQRHKSQHQKSKTHRKSETIKQPVTIRESLLCQSQEVHQYNENHQDHHGTQHYNDGIEIDETLTGPSPNELALPVPNDNVDGENRNNLTEGTLINEEILDIHAERPSSTSKSLEVRKEANQLTNNKNVQHERNSIDVTHKETVNESKSVPSSRQSELKNVPNNLSTDSNLASKRKQSDGEHFREQNFSGIRAYSELISAIADRVRQSKGRESNILVPPSPFRSGYSPHKSQGASFSVPPTQSPQIQPIHVSCAKSPTLVIPIYPYTCHQSKTSDPSTTTVVSNKNKESEDAATNVDPKILDANQKRVSNHKDFGKKQNQSRFSTKNSEFNRRSSNGILREPEISEDDDNSREQIPVHGTEITSDRETTAHQSRAVDLRLPSRRSDLHRLSRQSLMSRSRVYEKNKSQNCSLTSESTGTSFDRIIEIDKLLKKLNCSNDVIDPMRDQETVQPNEEPVPETHGNVQIQPKNLQNEVLLSEVNENIIEPVDREDVGNDYVYDLSPRIGKIYMKSLLSQATRSTLNIKARGRQRNTSNVRLPPHDDIEINIQRQLKSRKSQKLPPNRKSRRKLYSKENFEKDISDDETQPFENATHVYDATVASQQSMYDKKSKISKCRTRPEPVKFLTIQQLKERCEKSYHGPPPSKLLKRKKDPTKTISDDDELLFKVPEQPPPKRRTVQSRVNNRVGSNIKQILGVGINKSRSDEGNDSSDTSSDESSCSENLHKNNENEVSKQLNIIPASGESSFVKESKSFNNNVDRRSRRNDGSFVHVSPIRNESLSRRQQFFASPSLPAIKEISSRVSESNENQCDQEQPVEPELTRDNNLHSVSTFATRSQRSTMQNTSKSTQNTSRSTQNTSRSTKNTSKITQKGGHNQPDSGKNKTFDKENMSTKESNKSSTAGPSIEKEAAASDVSKKRGKRTKETSDKSSSSISTDNQGSTLRRSARKHRPPQPYWTSRFVRSEEICYKERKVKLKPKRRTRLGSINESPEAPIAEHNEPQQLATGSTTKPKDPKQLADDLFDAVKELSIHKQTLKEASKLPASNTTKATRSQKKQAREAKNNLRSSRSDTNSANEVANSSNSEVHILTDSGHGTESDLEAQKKSKNLLLSWLKNLVEPKTISSNPAIFSIFELSGVEIVPASKLVFQELDGVEYAYYSKSAGGNIYGYMRFHPGSIKRKVKTKSFELRILNITGELTLIVDKEEGKLHNGDFITVPRSTAYSIANKSDEMALIFFIKST